MDGKRPRGVNRVDRRGLTDEADESLDRVWILADSVLTSASRDVGSGALVHRRMGGARLRFEATPRRSARHSKGCAAHYTRNI